MTGVETVQVIGQHSDSVLFCFLKDVLPGDFHISCHLSNDIKSASGNLVKVQPFISVLIASERGGGGHASYLTLNI